jgi:hypothetical protein
LSVLDAEVTQKLDEAGTFRVRLPLTDPRTAEAQVKRIWRHYREGEGLVFAGLIETVNKQPEETLEISGPTLLEELLYKNTLLNRQYSNRDVRDVVDDLLSGTGWTRYEAAPTSRTLSWTLSMAQDWAAAGVGIAQAAGAHLSLRDVSTIAYYGQNYTLPHNSSGTNRCLYVAVATNPSTTTVSSVTYNGVALTFLAALTQGSMRIEFWRMVNPPVGLYNLFVGLSASATDVAIAAMTWEGVDQTTPESTPSTAGGNSAAPSLAISTPHATDIGLATTAINSAATYVADREQTEEAHDSVGGTRLSVCAEPVTVTARFDGESKLKAILLAAQQQSHHLREKVTESGGVLSKQLEIGLFGASSGAVLMGGQADEELFDDAKMAAVEDLTVEDTLTEVWNWVIPLGGGAGTDQLTLRFCTRNSPYVVQSTAGPDGELVYYIADAASITNYGQRERAFVAKDIQPLSNSKAALEVAANALYDLAATQLKNWWKDKQTAYRLTVRGLDPAVRPGDTVRLRWRGYALQSGVGYVYLDIDTDLYVLERTRRFPADGTEVSDLVVSNLDRALQTVDDVLIGKLDDTVRAFRTHVQSSVSNYTSGPILEELNASKPMRFDLLIDDNVTQLLRCRLRLKPRAIRSTATGAASGGGQTSSGGVSHSHSVSGQSAEAGGGQTSSSESAHTHSCPNHQHQILAAGAAHTYSAPTQHSHVGMHDIYGSLVVFGWDLVDPPTGWGGGDLYCYVAGGGTTSSGGASHSHSIVNHTHTVSATTSSTETSHTHNVSDHTHSQVYGIYEGTSAAGLTLKIDGVDRTAALGGPWNSAATLDITQYLQDSDGVVVQGIHAIEIGSTQLGRVEAWVDWTVAVQAIIAA